WAKKSPTEHSQLLLDIADRIEENIEELAVIETFDNRKPIRECLAADIPLVVDHFRYIAGVVRGEARSIKQIDNSTVAEHIKVPIGVVSRISSWNCPMVMGTWKLPPAVVTGKAGGSQTAPQSPATTLPLIEKSQDLMPES